MTASSRNRLSLLLLLAGLALIVFGTWHAWRQPLRLDQAHASLSWTQLDYWLRPIEDNPWKRPVGGMRAVYALPGTDKVWAAGEAGVILHSEDGGKTWSIQASPAKEQLNGVHFADGRRGWAVGGNGTILTTEDGGAHWATQPSPTKEWLYDVHFTDGQRGWAVGPNGTILATKDGGAHWAAQSSPTKEVLSGVHFTNGQRGWAVGGNGTILVTKNGGKTWDTQDSKTKEVLNGVYFADGQRGWAVGGSLLSDGVILATKDGGATWAAQASPAKEDLDGVHFADGRHGWAVGGKGTILATEDGGATWTTQASPVKEALNGVYFADGRRGWTVGGKGTILATEDGGANWAAQPSLTTKDLHGVHFANGQHGWAVGGSLFSDGVILATEDGGANWAAQASPTQAWLRGVHFADGQHGWAVGDNGTILATQDGGQTWTEPQYRRRPALWLYAAWLLGLALCAGAVWVWREPEEEPESAAEILVSDSPLQAGDHDALAFGDIAEGLSRFLRNAHTQPRLTIAVTGEWGSGKSSIMNLLQAKLRGQGYRPVWFNAWHHQKEEHFLASLAAAVRCHAAPPFWRLPHWVFWHLGGGRWLRTAVAAALIAGLGASAVFVAFEWHSADPSAPGLEDLVFQRLPLAYTPSSLRGLCKDPKIPPAWVDRLAAGLVWQPPQARNQASSKTQAYCQLAEAKTPDASRLAAAAFCAKTGAPQPCVFIGGDALLEASASQLGLPSATAFSGEQSKALLAQAEHPDPRSVYKNLPWYKDGLLGLLGLLGLVLGQGGVLAGLWGMVERGKSLMDKLKDLQPGQEPVGYRQSYGPLFERFTRALDRPLVLLIDDLDRCRQEQVPQVLEAVNFLVSWGDCYVVIGMAPSHVLRCVGLEFKHLAQESADGPASAGDGRRLRMEYARAYLEKLVNLEAPVPKPKPAQRENLVRAAKGGRRKSRWGKLAGLHLPLGLVLAAVLVAVFLAYHAEQTPPAKPVEPPTVEGGAKPAPAAPIAKPGQPGQPPTQPAPRDEGGGGDLAALLQPAIPAPLWAGLGLLALLLALGAARLVFARWEPGRPWLLRVAEASRRLWRQVGGPRRTHDTAEFRAALLIWHGLVAAHRNTPRSLKRFINRMRYFAMCRSVRREQEAAAGLGDAGLVALGALHYLNPHWLSQGKRRSLAVAETPAAPADPDNADDRQWLLGVPSGWRELRLDDGDPVTDEILAALARAIYWHRQQFEAWPPTAGDVKLFQEMAGGMEIL